MALSFCNGSNLLKVIAPLVSFPSHFELLTPTIQIMKMLRLSMMLLPLLASVAQAQVTTTPVGFTSIAIPAGPSNTVISLPLYGASDFTGTVASIDSTSQFTLTGAAFTAGSYATAAAPRLARVKSGSLIGRFFLITDNTTNQVTVSLAASPTVSNLALLVVGDSIEITPANTLGTVFGTTSPLLTSGSTVSTADNVYLLNAPGAAWGTYYHNGTNWRKSGSVVNQNNTIIYPDEGMLVIRIGGTAVTLTVTGAVPTTDEKTDISGSGNTFVANRFPVDTALSAFGFELTSGWLAGATVSVSDNVWAWNTVLSKWDQFYFNGTNWRKAGSVVNQNSTLIPAATAVIVIRNGSGSASSTLAQTLPYVP